MNMKQRVYLDSTIFSFYYDNRPDCIHRRNVTVDWLDNQSNYFELYTSLFTIDEISNPVYPGWEKVSAKSGGIPLLKVNDDLKGIIKIYLDNKLMPEDDAGDAAHLAIASYYEMDFLLTWNCHHLANVNKIRHVRTINLRLGLMTPEIITPEQLFMEENNDS